ncbi:hemerythrin domain-containing protein [Tamlana sp. I1]|uniref:hemerythrin domain-containing protein n=1 Tax=Tamlana sp. I1 TaxID=2762061 RepID=UPI0018908187|nr:hemerythrin domain-containing protein [Tamlana sp. I1]
MNTPKGIKRVKALQPLSREHHHGLLLSWKIKTGLAKNVSPKRINAYANWFYNTHLCPHFKIEENHVFPILGNSNELVKKALDQHTELRALFSKNEASKSTLQHIEKALIKHIRFEERELFNDIQKVATQEQLDFIESVHQTHDFKDNISDEFWV